MLELGVPSQAGPISFLAELTLGGDGGRPIQAMA